MKYIRYSAHPPQDAAEPLCFSLYDVKVAHVQRVTVTQALACRWRCMLCLHFTKEGNTDPSSTATLFMT